MKKQSEILPGYKVFDYQLVLNPHEDIRKKIIRIKQEFSEAYQTTSALYSTPHIAIATFRQYEMIEERLVNRLNVISMGYHPFKIELKDFGSLPTHTIYIQVIAKVAIHELVKQIRTEAQRLMKINEENKPHFILEPHITIGRKLQPWQYEKAFLEYSNKYFTGKFIADSMLLLKRATGELKYQVIKRFEFQNLLVGTTQGDLFS